MRGHLLGTWVGTMAMLSLMAGAVTAQDGGVSDALELLEAKGLRKLSSHFALSDEAQIGKAIRAAEPLKRIVTDAQKEVNTLELKIEEKKKTIVAYLQKRRDLRAQLASAQSVSAHNNLVNAMNELGDRVNLLQESNQEEEDLKTARAKAIGAAEKYVEHLLETRKLYDKLQDQYEQLAADQKITNAINAYSKTSTRQYQLGPSPSFVGYGRKLKSLEDTILSEAVDIRRGQGQLWYLSVMFNGKHAQEMAIDTGASLVVLPAKTATAAGLTPSADDPTIQCQLADGSVVEAKLIRAASVRVGKFTIENVDCAIMPPHLVEASPLLGQSFFKHFSYKIDTERSKLVMSKVEMPEKETGRSRKGK